MMKIAIFLLALVSALAQVQAVAEKRKPYYSSSKVEESRIRSLDFLRRSLNVVLETSRLSIEKITDRNARHLIVVNGRTEMFKSYDQFLERQCEEEKDLDGKKKTVRKGWKMLEETLFSLDKLDMHDGCFLQGVVYPSVMYESS